MSNRNKGSSDWEVLQRGLPYTRDKLQMRFCAPKVHAVSPEIYSLQRRGTKNSSGTYASCRARRLRRSPMKRLVKAGLIAVALAASATAAFAMPRVPASAIASEASDAVVLVKGGHGHGHGHMGRGGRGHHYGWGRGRGHHYGWSRGHHRHHH